MSSTFSKSETQQKIKVAQVVQFKRDAPHSNQLLKLKDKEIAKKSWNNWTKLEKCATPNITSNSEREIRKKFPGELMHRTSGMMLNVGQSAWNDNDEIRTLLCQSFISLRIYYRQRDAVNELHRRI
ncbi:MAG: hypothetical protein EZS28_008532 [Streblomastix strix]|uniref:Uncharacterized protein n=1 Tax=Streblomastix strix TaxID=222440 RepID=A0A5J4WMX7_9EUKA|nr:MAG: hypothetical protein EZS28_008532 [Streblomastix strix]